MFERQAEPYRRELKLHCYRMLGSLHEAEDAVQEAYLRAWRNYARFDGSGPFRAWLYRIATNCCLDAITARKNQRRLLPDQEGPAAREITLPETMPAADLAWLEPFPDSLIDEIADEAPGPEARYSSQETVRLAFVAAIQQLPPRQRAILLLCDVLGWSANETATLLGGTPTSVNSALQRARDTMAKRYPRGQPTALRPDPEQQILLDRYLRAWEGHDLDGFVALLKEDASFSMPPWPQWYKGRAAIAAFFAGAWKACGGLRMVQTAANGQPAFAVYSRDEAGVWGAHAIHVLTLEQGMVAKFTIFIESSLFASFGLPPSLEA